MNDLGLAGVQEAEGPADVERNAQALWQLQRNAGKVVEDVVQVEGHELTHHERAAGHKGRAAEDDDVRVPQALQRGATCES